MRKEFMSATVGQRSDRSQQYCIVQALKRPGGTVEIIFAFTFKEGNLAPKSFSIQLNNACTMTCI